MEKKTGEKSISTPKVIWAVCIIALATPYALMAQDSLQSGQLSLFDLLNMKITVASVHAERASDAPGSVTAYSSQDINRFGYTTITDLADMTPGYSTSEADNLKSLETRGGTASLNEKHLILIDGIPVNHVRNGKAEIQDELPTLFADRIEFLRGPASALYGIGAYNGVINVIPKSLSKEGAEFQTKMSVGAESGTPSNISDRFRESLVHQNLWGGYVVPAKFLTNALIRNSFAEMQLGYGTYSHQATLKPGHPFIDSTGKYDTTSTGPYNDAVNTQFGRMQVKLTQGLLQGLGAGFIGMYRQDGYGASWAGPTYEPMVSNTHSWETYIPYLRYDRTFAQNHNVDFYLKYNSSREKGLQANMVGWWAPPDTVGAFHFDVYTDDIEGKLTYSYNHPEALWIFQEPGIVAGVNYDTRWQDSSQSWSQNIAVDPKSQPWERLYAKPAETYSAFAQARGIAPVLKGLIITLGGRLDHGELDGTNYTQLSPRAALVLKIRDDLNLKAMYGTALKAPGPDNVSHNKEKYKLIQNYNDTNTLNRHYVLNPLKAENLQTVEGNLTYTIGNLYLSGSGFYNIISHTLLRQNYFDGVLSDFWQNVNYSTYAAGGELEAQFAPIEPLRFWISGGYTKTWAKLDSGELWNNAALLKDTAIGNVVEGIPSVKSYFGVSYTTPFKLSCFLVVKGVWSLVKMADTRNTDGTPRSSKPESVRTAADKASDFQPGYWPVDVNLRQALGCNLGIELGATNLFNTQYYSANGSVPMPNRTITFSVTYGL
jgi:outer membrane receptor protein involved in Fe transport